MRKVIGKQCNDERKDCVNAQLDLNSLAKCKDSKSGDNGWSACVQCYVLSPQGNLFV
jgi:hypothetical protein